MKLMIASDLHGSAHYVRSSWTGTGGGPRPAAAAGRPALPRSPEPPAPGLRLPGGGRRPQRCPGPAPDGPGQLRLRGGPDAAPLPHPGGLRPAGGQRPDPLRHPRPPVWPGPPAGDGGALRPPQRPHPRAHVRAAGGGPVPQPRLRLHPQGGSVGSYVVLEGKTFSWKNLEGEVYQSHTVE